MLRIVTFSSLLVVVAPLPAVARPDSPSDRQVCEPLRNQRGHLTGQQVCKTEHEWKAVLEAHAQRNPSPSRVLGFQSVGTGYYTSGGYARLP